MATNVVLVLPVVLFTHSDNILHQATVADF